MHGSPKTQSAAWFDSIWAPWHKRKQKKNVLLFMYTTAVIVIVVLIKVLKYYFLLRRRLRRGRARLRVLTWPAWLFPPLKQMCRYRFPERLLVRTRPPPRTHLSKLAGMLFC